MGTERPFSLSASRISLDNPRSENEEAAAGSEREDDAAGLTTTEVGLKKKRALCRGDLMCCVSWILEELMLRVQRFLRRRCLDIWRSMTIYIDIFGLYMNSWKEYSREDMYTKFKVSYVY